MQNYDCDVVVVGGGAAGMMAAGVAGFHGYNVLLVEKNGFTGKKLNITGKGRCNVTNYCDTSTFMSNIVRNSKFMYSSYNAFTSQDVIDFFEEYGVKTKVERGNRVFPLSDRAQDITFALRKFIKQNGVKVIQDTVCDVNVIDGQVVSVIGKNYLYNCSNVIIATGGLSYPLTGSTGDGYEIAKKLGHSVTELEASLVALETVENFCEELQGLSLKNVTLTLYNNDNVLFKEQGEMLFTHFGVSGPLVLSASAYISNSDNYSVEIDLKPALTEEVLDKRILRDFDKYKNSTILNGLRELMPKSIIPIILKNSGIDPEKRVNAITKEERALIVDNIKKIKLTVLCKRPVEEAIITRGGVSTSEVNPKTMESKIVRGLYFAGEILDLDGYTGGFNLQIAWSTGHAAGMLM